jgi:hypothetical protein
MDNRPVNAARRRPLHRVVSIASAGSSAQGHSAARPRLQKAILVGSMALAVTSARRLLMIAFALCALLCAQSASISAEQETHHASEHCCALCHLGPAPLLPAAITAVAAPVFSAVWLAASAPVSRPHELLATPADSRAPPA